MSSTTEPPQPRTLDDDIRFQLLKDDNRCSPFAYSEQQIHVQDLETKRKIEKSEKIAASEFKRQQMLLMHKLSHLQEKQQQLQTFHKSSQDKMLANRRHSSPSVASKRSTSPRGSPTGHQMKSTSISGHQSPENGQSPRERVSPYGSRQSLNANKSPMGSSQNLVVSFRGTRPDRRVTNIQEARRKSHELQEETTKMALQRFEAIITGAPRRATIAVGEATPSAYIPSASELKRLSFLRTKSTGVKEQNGTQEI